MKDGTKWEVTFDGKGLNDALSPYRYRLATLTTAADNTSFGEFTEMAINAHDELVKALVGVLSHNKALRDSDKMSPALIAHVEQALAKAGVRP